MLQYFGFVLACTVVILAFITATNYTQLTLAIMLYPLLVLFAYRVLPSRTRSKLAKSIGGHPILNQLTDQEMSKNRVGIADIDKRVFLKLIGGAGLFLFIYSIFNRNAESTFMRGINSKPIGDVGLKDTSGKPIDPAEKQPLDGYTLTEFVDDDTAYYGYTNNQGGWFVLKVNTVIGSLRYVKGNSNFPNNWNKRERLKYDYYHNVF